MASCPRLAGLLREGRGLWGASKLQADTKDDSGVVQRGSTKRVRSGRREMMTPRAPRVWVMTCGAR